VILQALSGVSFKGLLVICYKFGKEKSLILLHTTSKENTQNQPQTTPNTRSTINV
jgi:hypothetical protein